MRVAAVVVAYNGGRLLEECIASLVGQSLPELEIVLVDNASTDHAPCRVLRRFGDRVRTVWLPRNRGYAAGANAGWRTSSADVVVVLNQDLIVEPDCLALMLAALRASEGDALVSPKLVLRDAPDLVNCIGIEVHLSGVAWCRGLRTRADDWRGTVEVTAVTGAAFMARRHLLQALDGLDEAFFMYYEDVDLSLRARLAGATCLVACDAVAAHDWTLDLTPTKFGLLERNRRAIWRRLSAGEIRMLPVLLQAEAMGWTYALLHGPRFVHAKARAMVRPAGMTGAPSAFDARRLRPLLARRHPYELFLSGTVLPKVGAAVDRLTAAVAGGG